jgi:hypothetical protein
VVRDALLPGEGVEALARATDSVLAVTDRRFIVATGNRLALDLPLEQVRRIQFDIEKRRPATLVIVPEVPGHDPQVLAIPAEELERTARALTLVGARLAMLDD